MNNTVSDKATIAEPATALKGQEADFDEVMLAMDVVDTLRYRERVIDKELSTEEREKQLIARLREIYQNQGIEVPDHILRDGVKALEEKRFAYTPPNPSLQISLAKLYISRTRWLKPVALIVAIATFGASTFHFSYAAPRAAAAKAEQVELSQTIPAELKELQSAALSLAQSDDARTLIETTYQDGVYAVDEKNINKARKAAKDLELISKDLSTELTVRIVSRPGEMSGVFRIHDNDPNIRNYYVIVEGIDARGRSQKVRVTSEENQLIKRVEKWGVRVPEAVFNRVAADKRDDQIIQNAEIGVKRKGHLQPQYSINALDGAIHEW